MVKTICIIALATLAASGQTLTLAGPQTAQPGTIVLVDLVLSKPPANLAAIQWTIDMPSELTASAIAGQASDSAAKSLYCKPDTTQCVAIGTTANLYAAGVVAEYSIFVPVTMKPGKIKIFLIGVAGVTFQGDLTPLGGGREYGFTVSKK
jgi:hypothetical protein